MTCIVGIVKNEKVYLAADSAGVSGLNLRIRVDSKIFKKGEFIIGCTSSFRMIQLLRFSFTPPEIKDKDIFEYMCTDFINQVRECFKEGGFIQKYSEGDEKGGNFLVGIRGRLFQVESDFQVGETANGFNAIGCGANYALGSLHSTRDYTSPWIRLNKSLLAANEFSAGVSAPFWAIKTHGEIVSI